MAEKARRAGLLFRPHFKTAQSRKVGQWYREQGVKAITVSSVKMARYFADAGWKDITIAFPVNILEIDEINLLAEEISLGLTILDASTVMFLNNHLEHPVHAMIKIDAGYGRTGIKAENTDDIDEILNAIENGEKVWFEGFLAHAGHSYKATGKKEVDAIHDQTRNALLNLKNRYQEDWPDLKLSFGDTPSCSLRTNFEGLDEMRPGNFVFYDLVQAGIGACKTSQIAVAMAVPVVAIHADRDELIVHGGGVHFSKDVLPAKDGGNLFGRVVKFGKDGWSDPVPNTYVRSLSQEHGIVKLPKGKAKAYKIGDVLGVLPVHSCLTANLMRGFKTLSGETVDHLEGESPW